MTPHSNLEDCDEVKPHIISKLVNVAKRRPTMAVGECGEKNIGSWLLETMRKRRHTMAVGE